MAANSQSGFEQHRKPSRRVEFLKTLEVLVPWSALSEEIAQQYPKVGNILALHRTEAHAARTIHPALVQSCPLGMREARCDSARRRLFVGIDPGCKPVPDATTTLRDRRLLIDNE